ncbi:MAG: ATP-binding protein [Ignavibacteriae bacterium]|nr:ATP-binding protein [Ignavibacteriota bacterium]
MELLTRNIQNIVEKWLFKNKILIILGARQVGKTTFVRQMINKYGKPENYYNCELIAIKQRLESRNPYEIKKLFGDAKFIVFDEAQRIDNIGLSLKILYDTFPDVQIIATGSSSFDLKNKTNEPLTGRAIDFLMLPFSVSELSRKFSLIELESGLQNFLRFGMYPDVVNKSDEDSKMLLDNLTSRYLFKDVLEFESVRKPDLIVKLLQLLAFQTGYEVSQNELSVKLGVARKTIERYIDLLEKAYVIFRLKPFSRNLRKEILKKEKIYFYDQGIRNSIISQYNPLQQRNDIGALWENFCIVERMKNSLSEGIKKNYYFWRQVQGKEIDLIEEYNGKIMAIEFKWQNDKVKPPKEFLDTYQNSEYRVITKKDFPDIVS